MRERGELRALIYALAAATGLRRGELQRLQRRDIDLAHANVTVRASSAKSRKEQTVPLRKDIVPWIENHLASKAGKPTDLVFPKGQFPNMDTYRADLAYAGIAYHNDEDRTADFHAATRMTLATHLLKNGENARTVQAIMRHSSIELTTQIYTDADHLDVRQAIEAAAPKTPTPPAGKKVAPKVAPPKQILTDSKGLMATGEQAEKGEHRPNNENAIARKALLEGALGEGNHWSWWSDLNRRPVLYESTALPLSYTSPPSKGRIIHSSVLLATPYQLSLATTRTRL